MTTGNIDGAVPVHPQILGDVTSKQPNRPEVPIGTVKSDGPLVKSSAESMSETIKKTSGRSIVAGASAAVATGALGTVAGSVAIVVSPLIGVVAGGTLGIMGLGYLLCKIFGKDFDHKFGSFLALGLTVGVVVGLAVTIKAMAFLAAAILLPLFAATPAGWCLLAIGAVALVAYLILRERKSDQAGGDQSKQQMLTSQIKTPAVEHHETSRRTKTTHIEKSLQEPKDVGVQKKVPPPRPKRPPADVMHRLQKNEMEVKEPTKPPPPTPVVSQIKIQQERDQAKREYDAELAKGDDLDLAKLNELAIKAGYVANPNELEVSEKALMSAQKIVDRLVTE